MQKNLSNKELVAAGHQFAANISADTPLIDMAKMVSALAIQLDVALAAAAEAGKQRAAVMTNLAEMEDKLRIKQNHIKLRDTYILELEQRAEAAEREATNAKYEWGEAQANYDSSKKVIAELQEKLAELEKQEPVGTVSIAMDWNTHRNVATVNMRPDLVVAEMKNGDELFTRPVPAIDLNAVRAEAVNHAGKMIMATMNHQDKGVARALECIAEVELQYALAAQLRAGNAGKDGSHE
ncbi:hypothetical protein [Pantoea dispersa]|uniref:hypothetical protein n=1 Tax=Pantoea dispersa TaxID=59814 RepID=UPI00301780EA